VAFTNGFVHLKCDRCDHGFVVAFSCKNRGVCSSCAGRRMANAAAHLVDRVLPNVPVRQWVLSLPFELRRLVAFDAKVLSAVSRIFSSAVPHHYESGAKGTGHRMCKAGSIDLPGGNWASRC
jgi:hypothetical protein